MSSSSPNKNLPQELITDILTRLPVKPLLRFRSVSKPWLHLIDSKPFIKSHLHHSFHSNSHRSLLISQTYSHLFSVHFDNPSQPFDFGQPPLPSSPRLTYSCHGLILFVVSNELILWNPSTRKHRKLPPTEYEFDGGVYITDHYGFGYDSQNDDYKVVRVTEVDDDGEYLFSQAKMYSLRSDTWDKVDDFEFTIPCGKKVWGVYCNDALHTVVRHCVHREMINAFDLTTGKHREVPKMELTGIHNGVSFVEVLGGKLAAIVGRKMNVSEVWVMEEYGKKESWCRLFRFEAPMPEPYMNLTPLGWTRDGDEVVLNYDGRCLLAYSLRKRECRIVNVKGIVPQFYEVFVSGSTFWAEVCVGSLVSVESVGEGEKREVEEKKKERNRKKKEKRKAKKAEEINNKERYEVLYVLMSSWLELILFRIVCKPTL